MPPYRTPRAIDEHGSVGEEDRKSLGGDERLNNSFSASERSIKYPNLGRKKKINVILLRSDIFVEFLQMSPSPFKCKLLYNK
jgi:hypothetical protein